MTESHPSPEALEQFILGHLSTLEMRDIARHLLSGCSECQQATSQLWEPEDVFEEPEMVLETELSREEGEIDDEYDQVLDRVFGKAVATEALIIEQRKTADKLFEELRQYPAARRHQALGRRAG